ncbi:T9SS type A sorting domain-containing protein [candidate division KSB1 bacterium]|nr:T9SS type A sorting domain-containing protein [candidate division KSB1 bacterium]
MDMFVLLSANRLLMVSLFLMILMSLVHPQSPYPDDGLEAMPIQPLDLDVAPAQVTLTKSSAIKHSVPSTSRTPADTGLQTRVRIDDAPIIGHELYLRLNPEKCLSDSVLVTVSTVTFDGIQWQKTGNLDANQSVRVDLEGLTLSEIDLSLSNVEDHPSTIESLTIDKVILSTQKRVMLLGNSITAGVGASDGIGYRKPLYHYLNNNGFDVDFVGSVGDPPYEGHFKGGYKVADFYPRSLGNAGTGRLDVTYYMGKLRPHIVGIHLGTNDINSGYFDPAPYPDNDEDGFDGGTVAGQMATLVNYLLQWHNGNQGSELEAIIVNLIIPVIYQDEAMVEYTSEVAHLVRDFQTGAVTGQPEPVYLCDQFSRFREYPFLWQQDARKLFYDHLHPNDKGHLQIARTYYESFREVLSGPRWFSDVTWWEQAAGLDHYGSYQGAAVGDVDNDGREELYVTRVAPNEALQQDFIFRNSPNSPFVYLDQAGLSDPGGSRGAVFVDIDNDGDLDLFNGHSPGQNRLYENLGNSTFQDITDQAGIVNHGSITTTGVLAFDCDLDNDMDLYAINSRNKNDLYINDGSGSFQKQDRGADDHDEPSIPSLSGNAVDFDMDGDMDIFIAKREGPNALFVNNGNGYFTERASEYGLDLSHNSNGAVWADMDNDGDLDLMVTKSASSSDPTPRLQVYRNDQTTFTDISLSVNLFTDGYSTLVSDADLDGDLDLLLSNELDYYTFYRNDGTWNFTQIEDAGIRVFGGDPRGATVLDYDEDGDQDFYFVRSDAGTDTDYKYNVYNVLLRNNQESTHHYLKIHATGPEHCASAFGTDLWIYRASELGNPDELVGYRQIVSSSGHQSQWSMDAHFGLGNLSYIDLIARFSDGTFLIKRNVSADQTLYIEPGMSGGSAGAPDHLTIYQGDQQQGTVGTRLDDPLVVQLTDAENRPKSGIQVEFSVTQGDAQLVAPIALGDNIWVEAESGQPHQSAVWSYDELSSGYGLVMTPLFWDEPGSLDLDMNVPSGGSFALWIRAAQVAGTSRTVDVRVNQQPPLGVPITNYQQWAWIRVATTSDPDRTFDLNNGLHKLYISLPAGTLFDKVLLTPDLNYVPSGTGESGPSPNFTDSQGFASRFLELGQTAGPIIVQALVTDPVWSSLPGVEFQILAKAGDPVSAVKGNDGQVGDIGVPLAQPFLLTLRDAFGNPVKDFPVQWSVKSGRGTLDPGGLLPTNTQGISQTGYIPGDAGSSQNIQASAAGVPGTPFVFQATIRGVADVLEEQSGNNQTAPVGEVVTQALKVKVKTESGDPAVGYPVVFTVKEGQGRLATRRELFSSSPGDSVITASSDDQGIATVYWKLGPLAGLQQVLARADGLAGSPVSFQSTALTRDPYHMIMATGDGQQIPVSSLTPEPLVVRITDEYSNPIPNHPVRFTLLTEGMSFDGVSGPQVDVLTDNSGFASIKVRIGTVAQYDYYKVMIASQYSGQSLQGSPSEFKISGLPGPASTAVKLTEDGLIGTIGEILPQPLQVKITDVYGNVIPDYVVDWSVVQGGGSIEGATAFSEPTDERGLSTVNFRLGNQAGTLNQIVKAEFPGLSPASIQFTASARATRPHKMIYVSGDGQKGPVQATIAPLQVKILDAYDNTISNQPVTFTVTSALGHIGGTKVFDTVSSGDGIASAVLTLGDEIGDSNHVVLASSTFDSEPLLNSPVRFIASATMGNPHRLIPITDGTLILGAAYRELSDPVTVKVVDDENNPVTGIPVEFQVVKGDGQLSDGSKRAVIYTNAKGLAEVGWILGAAGVDQQIRASVTFNQNPLLGSPLFFNALAAETHAVEMIATSPLSNALEVGSVDTLSVKVVDALGLAVVDHPVGFQVQEGSAGLGVDQQTEAIARSDRNGIARVQVKIGNTAGQNSYIIQAFSTDSQSYPLEGSPVQFVYSALPAFPDINLSEISASTPVPATGLAGSKIRVLVKDKYGNPVPGETVMFVSSPAELDFQASQGVTNAFGEYSTVAKSVNAGAFIIRARLNNGGYLSESAVVEFIESNASTLETFGNNPRIVYRNSEIKDSLAVIVRNYTGQPVSGYPIHFECNELVEIMTETERVTNSDGIASVRIKATQETGAATVTASASGLEGDPVTFNLQVSDPENIQLFALDSPWTGTVDTHGASPFECLVGDAEKRPISGIRVLLTSMDVQKVRVDNNSVTSGSDGRIRVDLTFGQKAGKTQVRAQGDPGSFILEIPVEGIPDSPEELQLSGGNQQIVPVNTLLPESLQVRIVDKFQNGVAGIPLDFDIVQGDGVLMDGGSRTTNSDGYGTAVYRTGAKTGVHLIKATSPAVPDYTIQFQCLAVSAGPAALELISGGNQVGVAGHQLANPIQIRVLDEFGNGVPGIKVNFEALLGNGAPDPAIAQTDARGRASIRWVLGNTTGSQQLQTSVPVNPELSLTIGATVMPNGKPLIEVEEFYRIREGDSLGFSITVTDPEKDPFSVGVLNLPSGASMDSSYFFWSPGYDQAGEWEVTFVAQDSAGAQSQRVVSIQVDNTNRIPKIVADATEPANLKLGSVHRGEKIRFYVAATDADGDTLHYVWLVNKRPRSTGQEFIFDSQLYDEAMLEITALVFDQQDTVSVQWQGDLITRVELAAFSARFEPFKGSVLVWKTSAQVNHAGFYVCRSESKNGPFKVISDLIRTSAERQYTYVDSDVPAVKSIYYKIQDIDDLGRVTDHPAIQIAGILPSEFALYQNYPNPFNPVTTIPFSLPEKNMVRLVIYDINGRVVRELVNSTLSAGYHHIEWDGCNDYDERISSGVYFVALTMPGKTATRKMILLK